MKTIENQKKKPIKINLFVPSCALVICTEILFLSSVQIMTVSGVDWALPLVEMPEKYNWYNKMC